MSPADILLIDCVVIVTTLEPSTVENVLFLNSSIVNGKPLLLYGVIS
jgi:hypothetical protein